MSGSVNVVLNKIPYKRLLHSTVAEINSAGNTATGTQRTLLIGQVSATSALGSDPNSINKLAICAGVGDAIIKCGRGSMLHLITRKYKIADNYGEVWYLPMLDDPNAQAATLPFTVFNGPTAAGTLPLLVAGQQCPVGLSAGQSPTSCAAAIAAAVNLNLDLPVTAAVGTGPVSNASPPAAGAVNTVTFTAKNKGLCGNDIDVRLAYYGAQGGDVMPPGLYGTGIIVGTGTQLSGGSGNPTALLNALDNLADEPFDFVVFPYTDGASLGVWQTFMDGNSGRWAWDKMIYGGAFAGYRGTYGAATAFGVTRNDPAIAIMPVYDAPEPSWIWAARIAGDYAVSCRAHPSIPFQDIVTDLLPPPILNRFTDDELETLLSDGLGAFKVVGGQVVVNRLVTTYQVDPQGDPDNSYQDVESRYQLMFAMRDLRTYLDGIYSRKIWVDDNTRLSGAINNAVAMPSMLKASTISRYRFLEDYGVVQDSDVFAEQVQVQKAGSAARIYWPGDLANQLRQIDIGVFFSKT